LLPPSKFNIDDYKRQFFAAKDIPGQIQWLFDNFDAEGWSMWEISYNKIEGEGK
jgi:elongation factor 1-gamma